MSPKMREPKIEHEFTLVLSGEPRDVDELDDALFEAGCDDATLAVRGGRYFLTFSRVAPSVKDAVLSAIEQLRAAKTGLDALRVDHGQLATQSDIARRLGKTRQLVHQYISGVRGPGEFPAPASDSGDQAPRWYWREVAQWLSQHDLLPAAALREAEEIDTINAVLEMEHRKSRQPVLLKEVLMRLQPAPILKRKRRTAS